MDYKVDLHTHSTYSDGKLKPTELVKWAKENEINQIALTDHDCIEGIKEFLISGEALEVDTVAGVELTCKYEGDELHILGLFIDPDNVELKQFCYKAMESRKDRNKRLVEELRKDYPITMEELEEKAISSYIGKRHIAQLLIEKGFYQSEDEVFERVFKQEPYSEIKKELYTATTNEAIEVIKKSGGKAVWAHPGKVRKFGNSQREEYWEKILEVARELKKQGLVGIECITTKHTDYDRLKAIEVAEKTMLHITQGSDFHG